MAEMNKDKVIIPTDLWYKVLDALEDNKELRQQCYDAQMNLYSSDLCLIKNSLKLEGMKYPRMEDISNRLIRRISL